MDKQLLNSEKEETIQINYESINDTPFTMVERDDKYALLIGNVLVTDWDTERKTRNKALIKNMTWAQVTGIVMAIVNNNLKNK